MAEQRLDKWLWCARFYRTRTDAQEAVKAGHVTADAARAKPARNVTAGTRLSIRKPPFEWQVEVLGITPQRVSPSLAQALYRESEESRTAREHLARQLRAEEPGERASAGRPDRRGRRELSALKRQVPDPVSDTDEGRFDQTGPEA